MFFSVPTAMPIPSLSKSEFSSDNVVSSDCSVIIIKQFGKQQTFSGKYTKRKESNGTRNPEFRTLDENRSLKFHEDLGFWVLLSQVASHGLFLHVIFDERF